MDLDGTILVSLVVMLAVIASIVRDLYVYRRRHDRVLARIAGARLPAAPVSAFPPASVLAGEIGDPDPIHELALRLGALRSLGLDHVRTAHPLFRAPGVDSALAFDAPPIDVPEPAGRRPRHRRLRSTAPLRLVVSRAELPG